MKYYKKSILATIMILSAYKGFAQDNNQESEQRFPVLEFNIQSFKNPTTEFGPLTRWWWPGNDVNREELVREINLFADNGFGGVEIQPLNLGIPLTSENMQRALSWDTPEYYSNLSIVMEAARERGLMVDLTNGSGWPPGGSFLDPDDGFLSLHHTDTIISGIQSVNIALPMPVNPSVVPSILQAVIATRVLHKEPNNDSETIPLDAASTVVLTDKVNHNILTWDVPEGDWAVIAFWAIPGGETTMIAALPRQGPVVDHLDSVKVLKNYNHLFGDRTGLDTFFGNPFRAVFNDSYEFKVDRHYSSDFLKFFREKRGYDAVAWLPANMQKGYNMVEYMNPHADPYFSFSEEDWRIRYDYDVTIGELLEEHFLKTSKEYLENRGLMHRTQPYGLNMDMIAIAGMASIPETESMNGSEGKLKLTSSGGHLYNRSLISSESVVFINKAYTTTPQMIRLAVDKLFSAGVNQIIYHGIPYRYMNESIGKEGWYPFSISFIPGVNFASNLGESNPYWKYQKDINKYIARTQYALQAGKPMADVLIYYPFLTFSGFSNNPEEIFTNGSLDRPDISNEPLKNPQAEAIRIWSEGVWSLINELDRSGITWEWVNDASLQVAELTPERLLNIRGNLYKALILPDVPYIQLKSAEHINHLTSAGMNLLIYGDLPDKQPSFLNWEENDKKTKDLLLSTLSYSSANRSINTDETKKWISDIRKNCTIRYNGEYPNTRQVIRELDNGSRIHFIWNMSDQWQDITLLLDDRYIESYRMNAEDGKIFKNEFPGMCSYKLPPYTTILLFAGTQSLGLENTETFSDHDPSDAIEISSIYLWDISSDSLQLKESPLFDWKTKEVWKYQSSAGEYHSGFRIESISQKDKYLLDLGKVYHTAELYINGKFVATRLYEPFVYDISRFIQEGDNTIAVRVIPTLLNDFVGRAESDQKYAQFRGRDRDIMSQGLAGPVVLYKKE